MRRTIIAIAAVCCIVRAEAQDSVDVTFRYSAPTSYTGVSVPGEFNGWNNTAWPMANQGDNLWTLTKRLRMGGNPSASGVPGAWQYKFFPTGTSGEWPNDPLNHHVNTADNSNTFIYTKDPTFYHLLPNQRTVKGALNTSLPTISAYIFPKVGAEVDTSTISVQIDSVTYAGIGSAYNVGTRQLVFVPPVPLPSGTHRVVVRTGTTGGGMNADTVTFSTLAGTVQITSRGNYTTRVPLRTIRGILQDTTIHTVRLVRNGADTTDGVVSGGSFEIQDTLTEGPNTFRAVADSAGTILVSDPVTFTLFVNHAPTAQIVVTAAGGIMLQAGASTDPDPGQTGLLTYRWSEDPANPAPIGISGSASATLTVPVPPAPGEYYVGLIATDPDGNRDTTRSYFVIRPGGAVRIPQIADNPAWAKEARIYFLFPKAMSSEGTINAAALHLQRIKDLGFSVIWMMPVMDNAQPINNGYGPGYDIVDFYNVAPEYGTNEDFKSFVGQAHALGMKVILDVTPNHTSRQHPWCVDAHTYKKDSPYWTWYEHATITANTNNLGDCLDEDGFNYYCGFSKELQNYNWNDPDAQAEMINVYRTWVKEFGVDGFRLDVYWGPHRRYGEAVMGKPVRDALKHVRPDILLLGEDDGTGSGTEVIYADHVSDGVNGGLDASYDFKMYFNAIRNFGFTPSALSNLYAQMYNGGFYPGENALYMRFMESQDEDRIFYAVPSGTSPSTYYDPDPPTAFARTMPMASVLFTAPGVPMVWNGQEVGWGYGIAGPKEARNRSVINWNFQGRGVLSPHYQKLAHIRGQFPAFTRHKLDTNRDGAVTADDSLDFVTLPTTDGTVYAYTRPNFDQNGLAVMNFSGSAVGVTVMLNPPGAFLFSGGIQPGGTYYFNELLTNTRFQVSGSGFGSGVLLSLPAYGSAIYSVSTRPESLNVLNPVTAVAGEEPVPEEFALEQNYPNPFNPSTTVRFSVPEASVVSLRVYDVLGREVALLADGPFAAGVHTCAWNGRNTSGVPVGSGMYVARLAVTGAGGSDRIFIRKMALVK